jgi:hypothetical protein
MFTMLEQRLEAETKVRAACPAMSIPSLNQQPLEAPAGRHSPEILRPREHPTPAWRTIPVRWTSNGWSPSPWATLALDQPGSPPSVANPVGGDRPLDQWRGAGAGPPNPGLASSRRLTYTRRENVASDFLLDAP